MTWNETFGKATPPSLAQIDQYIASSLWLDLCSYIENSYEILPSMEHSICSGAPGWNLKYKRGGRALCTLYPAQGFFTCLVSIGSKEAMEAELLLAGCTEYVQELYRQCKPYNGGRWLMIEVKSPEILADVKALIGTRAKPSKSTPK